MAAIKAPSAAPTTPFSTTLKTDVAKALAQHAAKTGIPKSTLVDKALRKLLKLS